MQLQGWSTRELPEMVVGESVARALLKVLLKGVGLFVVGEPDGGDAFPRKMLLRVSTLACIVFAEAPLKVRRLADITLGWI